jgi:uncharacterized protein YcfJ
VGRDLAGPGSDYLGRGYGNFLQMSNCGKKGSQPMLEQLKTTGSRNTHLWRDFLVLRRQLVRDTPVATGLILGASLGAILGGPYGAIAGGILGVVFFW